MSPLLLIPRHLSASRAALVAVVSSTLMLGACSSLGGEGGIFAAADDSSIAKPMEKDKAKTELEKATEYWGKQFNKEPRDPKNAVNYARNLKAMGSKDQAFMVLQKANSDMPANKDIASEYGRVALELGHSTIAQRVLEQADDPSNPDWRVISARATALAKQGQYGDAIPLYERALAAGPGQTSVLNNLALAHAMNGNARRAEDLLVEAQNNGATDPKIRQNLALVLGLQGKYDDAKTIAGRDLPPDSAQANVDYMRLVVGLPQASAPVGIPGQPAPQALAEASSSAARGAPVRTAASAAPKPANAPVQLPGPSAGMAASSADALIAQALARQSDLDQNRARASTAKGSAIQTSSVRRPKTSVATADAEPASQQLRPSGQ